MEARMNLSPDYVLPAPLGMMRIVKRYTYHAKVLKHDEGLITHV
jgi:hypothetical protein